MKKQVFNKKNVLRFANYLYEEKSDGTIYYRPLCFGALARKNGELVGCILGDLYEEFEGKPVWREFTEKDWELINKGIFTRNGGSVTLLPENGVASTISENRIAAVLSKKAKLDKGFIHERYDVKSARKNLESRILYLQYVNDNSGTRNILKQTEDDYIERAKAVRSKLVEIADCLG